MKSLEKILNLIEQGDPIPILADESLTENFNFLLQHDLIEILDARIILTQKGKIARDKGFGKMMEELKEQQELSVFSPSVQKKESRILNFCFGICVSFLFLFLAFSLTDCSITF
ncbi:hypothetical protein [Salinimicrobium oceani]|uniref:Uncharacterized protein n=1 Tax=Salinimicrobium oceani TaxID=2722702 RepID=A0ABX1CXR4_9FLAO|nr:hypothetical protein [Salinimicrobium oceani]NJW53044.1 hypothetical protein [Salinimicrobium oceani]